MRAGRYLIPAFLFALALAVPAFGQAPAPFDMTPERGPETTPPAVIQPAPAPPPVETPQPQPETQPAPPATLAPETPQPASPAEALRYLLPYQTLELSGENAREGVSVFLTTEQAATPATLEVGYLNAVVAAPEASQLRVDINGTTVLTSPIASSSATADVSVAIPQGILRPGANLVEFLATQRHRTDCSVQSTYELWTRLDSTRTFLRFDNAAADVVTRVSELGAIGMDADGVTRVNLFAPGMDNGEARQSAIRLMQDVGLALRVPELTIDVADALPTSTPPGTLNVLMASAENLPDNLEGAKARAAAGPTATMVNENGSNTLLVTGPTWKDVEAAAGEVAHETALDSDTRLPERVDIPYPVPQVAGARVLTLSDLGVRTVEFNGRRYTTTFDFALPPDFYSNMFGQATLLLNSVYSADVLPESQFNIYVNGQIASSTPILRTSRGFSRDTPINFPMRNFRPGRNRVMIEILIQTEADRTCPPGLTQTAPSRFIFSANSRLRIPEFARIGAFPDLAAFAGTGAPYVGEEAAPLFLGDSANTMAAALTVLTRAAIASGASIPVKVVEGGVDPTQDALIAAPLPKLPQDLVARSGVALAVGSGGAADDTLIENFRNASGSNANPFDALRGWAASQLGLAPQNLWLVRSEDGAFVPQSQDGVILSQVRQPEGGVWTYLTIPDDKSFLESARRLALTVNWRAISGRVSALGSGDPNVIAVQPSAVTLVPTQPPSLSNYRLIAANWLSTNILEFTLLLGAVAAVLTLVTWALLKSVGRH